MSLKMVSVFLKVSPCPLGCPRALPLPPSPIVPLPVTPRPCPCPQGKEFETRLKEKKPGDLSDELRIALGMPVGPVSGTYGCWEGICGCYGSTTGCCGGT